MPDGPLPRLPPETLARYRLRLIGATNGKLPDLSLSELAASFLARQVVPLYRRRKHLGAVYVNHQARGIACTKPYLGYLSRLEAPTFLGPAMVLEAAGWYVFHHRPVATLRPPGREDVRVAKQLRDAGEVAGVRLLDYLLVGDGEVWRSLGREGRVQFHALGEEVGGPPRDGRSRVRPKYRNPENPQETWSGRGRPARWLQELLDAGARIEDFLVGE